MVGLVDDVSEELNERTFDQLLLERGRLEHLVEGEHEEQVSSQVLELILVLLQNGSDAETGCAATIVR